MEEFFIGFIEVMDVFDIINDKFEGYYFFVWSIYLVCDYGWFYLGGDVFYCNII